MLASSRSQFDRQAKLAEHAVRDSRRVSRRGAHAVARMVGTYQAAAIATALQATPDVLTEQGISADAAATVDARSLLTAPSATTGMLQKVASQTAFDRLVQTMVQDAGRTATQVDLATRRHVTVYVREPGGACCARCAVLAGRVYRYSTGFQRHPNCGCVMVPTTEDQAADIAPSPDELFRSGQVHGLSKADTKAINSGADISQVVNVRRKQAGLVVGGSVVERAGRMTPAGIFRVASDQTEAQTLLRRFGYIA